MGSLTCAQLTIPDQTTGQICLTFYVIYQAHLQVPASQMCWFPTWYHRKFWNADLPKQEFSVFHILSVLILSIWHDMTTRWNTNAYCTSKQTPMNTHTYLLPLRGVENTDTRPWSPLRQCIQYWTMVYKKYFSFSLSFILSYDHICLVLSNNHFKMYVCLSKATLLASRLCFQAGTVFTKSDRCWQRQEEQPRPLLSLLMLPPRTAWAAILDQAYYGHMTIDGCRGKEIFIESCMSLSVPWTVLRRIWGPVLSCFSLNFSKSVWRKKRRSVRQKYECMKT